MSLDRTAITASVSTGPSIGSLATDTQFTYDASLATGSTWNVTADGTEVTDNTSNNSLVTKLSAISGLDAFVHDNTIVVLKAAGGSLPLTVKVNPNGFSSSTAQSTVVTLGGTVAPDEVWTIAGAGATETETVGSSDTLSDIVSRMVSGPCLLYTSDAADE